MLMIRYRCAVSDDLAQSDKDDGSAIPLEKISIRLIAHTSKSFGVRDWHRSRLLSRAPILAYSSQLRSGRLSGKDIKAHPRHLAGLCSIALGYPGRAAAFGSF